MTKPNNRRKTRSDESPLTLHKTGQYCKKIKGKLCYFGSDRSQVFERYLEQAPYSRGGYGPRSGSKNRRTPIKAPSDLYLEHQESKVEVGELTARHYADQVVSLRKLVRFLGQHREVEQVCALDLQNYKKKLQRTYRSAHRIDLHLSIMKAIFRWATKTEILEPSVSDYLRQCLAINQDGGRRDDQDVTDNDGSTQDKVVLPAME